jgi:hypothetical protein
LQILKDGRLGEKDLPKVIKSKIGFFGIDLFGLWLKKYCGRYDVWMIDESELDEKQNLPQIGLLLTFL